MVLGIPDLLSFAVLGIPDLLIFVVLGIPDLRDLPDLCGLRTS